MTTGTSIERHRRAGVTAISLFFAFGASMSALAAALLFFPGTPLDRLWSINPRGHQAFLALGWPAVLLMFVVCAACLVAAIGLWRRRRWGIWTAIAILSVNLAGDTVNAVVLRDGRTLIGLPVGGLMLIYLLSVRAEFRNSDGATEQ